MSAKVMNTRKIPYLTPGERKHLRECLTCLKHAVDHYWEVDIRGEEKIS